MPTNADIMINLALKKIGRDLSIAEPVALDKTTSTKSSRTFSRHFSEAFQDSTGNIKGIAKILERIFSIEVGISSTTSTEEGSSKRAGSISTTSSSFSSWSTPSFLSSKAHPTIQPPPPTTIASEEPLPSSMSNFSSTTISWRKPRTTSIWKKLKWRSIDNFCFNLSKSVSTWKIRSELYRYTHISIDKADRDRITWTGLRISTWQPAAIFSNSQTLTKTTSENWRTWGIHDYS